MQYFDNKRKHDILVFQNRTYEREESSAQTPLLFLFDSHPEIQAYSTFNIQYPIFYLSAYTKSGK